MAKVTSKKAGIVSGLIISLILMISITTGLETFAEEKQELRYKSANDVQIHTVITTSEGVEESDGFQVYKQVSGFDRLSAHPSFKLEGVASNENVLLYQAADTQSSKGVQDRKHNFGFMDIEIYLHKDGMTLRHFKYMDCHISDYKVDTLFDKEEAWMGKGFAIIDEFTFQCDYYLPMNPLYNLKQTNGYTVGKQSISSNDIKDTSEWSEDMRAKKPQN